MDVRPAAVAALLLIGSAAAVTAQDAGRVNASDAATEAPQQSAQAIDVSRLPLDIERIHRQLRQTTIREEIDGLNLRYTIDVYGRIPLIELFTAKDNLLKGPVPYGAPTHADILQMITPQEYRAPAADFSGLLRWLADKGKDKK
jgi:hypothetical protein